MDPSKSDLSTRQLIAEAEGLRGPKGTGGRDMATRQLVRDAERLIGRKPAGRRLVPVLVVALAVVAAAAAYFYLRG